MRSAARDERTWYALADPTRRRILDLLRRRPRTTGQLSDEFPQSRYSTMNHLNILEEAGLVTVRRQGRERWNYVNATPLRRIYERWLTPYQQLWASSLSRLGAIVEGEVATTMADSTDIRVRQASIEQVTEIAGPPAVVFDALTKHIAHWWPHVTYETTTRPDLRIEPHVGGRFIEKNGANERLYAIVTRFEPEKRLWMQGSMGLGGCIFGTITFDLEAAGEAATTVALSHRMIGEIDEESVAMYRGGWKVLLEENLSAYIATGAEAWSVA
jgi:DNA-binding transcriptional ArsR family regulator/uncharacterized protein YndB with AHSA1/START domain